MSPDTENKKGILDLESYHVSFDTGFMLPQPLSLLPPYFEPWNKLALNLPLLVKNKQVREAVNKLSVLDHNELQGHRQLRLAHLQLSLIVSGYVWQDGDQGVATVLPKSLAVPYTGISERLGIEPVLCHASLALANWGLMDTNKPRTLENLTCLYRLPGEFEAEWFVTVTTNIEFTFAKCLKPIVQALEVIHEAAQARPDLNKGQAEESVTGHLDSVTAVIKAMEAGFGRMHENLAAKTFFNILRPFLGGWGGEGNSLPDGLIYEGISDDPIKLPGGSAAQSSTLQVLDAFLGVEHTDEKRSFLVRMRDFMPSEHRRFVNDLEKWPHQLRDYVLSSTCPKLKASYNRCVAALADMRSYHIGIVTKYIVVASKEANEGNYESLDNKGTGGTSLIPFLKVLRTDTETKAVPVQGKQSTQKRLPTSVLPKVLIGVALIAVGAFVATKTMKK